MIIRDVVGVEQTKGLFGVEVEVEGIGISGRTPSGWERHDDGSLRGESHEFVFSTPLDFDECQKSIQELYSFISKEGGRILDSVRAGVHVHLNVQERTPIDLMKIIVLYTCLESVFSKLAGEGRSGNLFCLQAHDAEFYTQQIIHSIEAADLRHLNSNNLRYSALNPTSLYKFGSLEFRSLRTPVSPDKILLWVEAIYNLYRSIDRFVDPTEIIYAMSGDGYTPFIESVLGQHITKGIKWEDYDVREGILQAQQMAFSCDDWGSFNDKFSKKKKENYEANWGVYPGGPRDAAGVTNIDLDTLRTMVEQFNNIGGRNG